MKGHLLIRNRRRPMALDTRILRQFTRTLLEDHLKKVDYFLELSLVGSREMSRLHERFLRQPGPTDVITFDYSVPAIAPMRSRLRPRSTHHPLNGEIFICLDEAVANARRFRTAWQSELARYIIHGVLHLCGYNDTTAVRRTVMKRAENRLLRALGAVVTTPVGARQRAGRDLSRPGRRFALSNRPRAPRLSS